MKILITGHRGLIGSKLLERLKIFHDMYGIDKRSNNRNTTNLYLSKNKYDMIIHCADNCIIRDVIKDSTLAPENIAGTLNVLDLARRTKCKKVIMFSSSRVESDNHNPYITSKKYMEEETKAYHECYGIDYIIIRPETVWGPNDNPVRVIPTWINNALKNKSIIVYGNKEKELPPIYVDDFVDLIMDYILKFDEYKNNTYKVSGYPINVELLINIIKDMTNSKSRIIWKKPELSQPQKCNNKFSKMSGYDNFAIRLSEVLKWTR